LICQLSGGQKRRVSLVIALIHEPQLLLLDEPTVGVDPIIAHVIWKHLRQLCLTKRTSIVITTHYIEEASKADIVAFMRDGRIIAEEVPEDLMARYGSTSLEQIFVQLATETQVRSITSRQVKTKPEVDITAGKKNTCNGFSVNKSKFSCGLSAEN